MNEGLEMNHPLTGGWIGRPNMRLYSGDLVWFSVLALVRRHYGVCEWVGFSL